MFRIAYTQQTSHSMIRRAEIMAVTSVGLMNEESNEQRVHTLTTDAQKPQNHNRLMSLCGKQCADTAT